MLQFSDKVNFRSALKVQSDSWSVFPLSAFSVRFRCKKLFCFFGIPMILSHLNIRWRGQICDMISGAKGKKQLCRKTQISLPEEKMDLCSNRWKIWCVNSQQKCRWVGHALSKRKPKLAIFRSIKKQISILAVFFCLLNLKSDKFQLFLLGIVCVTHLPAIVSLLWNIGHVWKRSAWNFYSSVDLTQFWRPKLNFNSWESFPDSISGRSIVKRLGFAKTFSALVGAINKFSVVLHSPLSSGSISGCECGQIILSRYCTPCCIAMT